MSYLLVLCIVLGIELCSNQENNLDFLINKIFNSSKEENSSSDQVSDILIQPSTNVSIPPKQRCEEEHKECVPYFLCRNDTIVKDGSGIIDIRIDGAECSYLDTCCSIEDKVTTPIIKIPQEHTKGCGYQNVDGVGFKISGRKNNESQFAEFPWMVAILQEETYDNTVLNLYKCGGSLIGPNVVLTAAHCVQKASQDDVLKVRAGEWDTQSESEILPFQERTIVEIASHPSFNNESLINDVAIAFLDYPFEYAENVKPICLPNPEKLIDLSICYATGWGKNEFGKNGKYQVILKKIDLKVIPNNQCQENLRKTRLGKHFLLDKSFVCAGGEAGKDTCKGDGGSPLFCLLSGTSNRFSQVGIVAWGIGCGDANIPGVYANVSDKLSWIQNQLEKKGIKILD